MKLALTPLLYNFDISWAIEELQAWSRERSGPCVEAQHLIDYLLHGRLLLVSQLMQGCGKPGMTGQ